MIIAKGDITNMKKRPTFREKGSRASWKDLNFDMTCIVKTLTLAGSKPPPLLYHSH
jgi:hypothetical protein